MDLFDIAKNEARRTYKEMKPATLDEYITELTASIRITLSELNRRTAGFKFSEEQISSQAKKTATWWWRNVFKKNEDMCGYQASHEDAFNMKEDTAAAMLSTLRCFGSVIIDTETTGFGKDDRIIELSIIDMEGETLFSSLINPHEPIPSHITGITGIDDSMVYPMPPFKYFAKEIYELLNGKIILGWNVPFDIRMLRQEFSRLGMSFDSSNSHDLMPLCACASGMETKSVKLIKMKQELQIGESQAHRSLSDCLDTLAVMDAVIEKYNNSKKDGRKESFEPISEMFEEEMDT